MEVTCEQVLRHRVHVQQLDRTGAHGDAAVLEQVRPVFSTYAAEIVHLGAVGTGQQAKLLNNTLFTAQIVLADDAMRLGATLGLDPAGLARPEDRTEVFVRLAAGDGDSGRRLEAAQFAPAQA